MTYKHKRQRNNNILWIKGMKSTLETKLGKAITILRRTGKGVTEARKVQFLSNEVGDTLPHSEDGQK